MTQEKPSRCEVQGHAEGQASPLGDKSGRPVLITGAAGFIGSHLTDRLIGDGIAVVGLDNFCDYYDPARKRHNLESALGCDHFTLEEADFRDAAAVDTLFDRHRPCAVAHLGACANVRYSIGRAPLYTDVNIVGSINLLEAALKYDNDVFVFASTSSVYGHAEQLPFVETDPCNQPLAPYPASKKALELIGFTYHNLHQLNFTALRFFSVYGPRGRPDMMPYVFTERIANDEPITLFDEGKMKRDWTYVQDIVDGVIAALERPLGYEIINLGRGEPVIMAEFVHIIEHIVGQQAKMTTPPAPPSEPKVTFANIDKARSLLSYEPRTSVADGMSRFWDWYQQVSDSG